jgi:membrane-bound metal-dependent hydrolase YbcI (DUF457 family)
VPITPFHFGLGLAAKAALERRFSLVLFVALQVVTDIESLYNLTYHREPVHRHLHTFLGATVLALLISTLLHGTLRWWDARHGRIERRPYAPVLATALFATWSHVLLDGVMHTDTRPLWPLTDFNPLLAVVRVDTLHLACLALGFFGLVALAFQWSLRDRDA